MSPQKRWPTNAESARIETLETAREAASLIRQARHEVKRNPLLVELMLADALTALERIQRLMVEARQGKDDGH